MSKRIWAYLFSFVLLCLIAGTWYNYKNKCHGMDDCAAKSAEDHERDKPREAR